MGRPKLQSRTPSKSITVPKEDIDLMNELGEGCVSKGYRIITEYGRIWALKQIEKKKELEKYKRIRNEKAELDYILS